MCEGKVLNASPNAYINEKMRVECQRLIGMCEVSDASLSYILCKDSIGTQFFFFHLKPKVEPQLTYKSIIYPKCSHLLSDLMTTDGIKLVSKAIA